MKNRKYLVSAVMWSLHGQFLRRTKVWSKALQLNLNHVWKVRKISWSKPLPYIYFYDSYYSSETKGTGISWNEISFFLAFWGEAKFPQSLNDSRSVFWNEIHWLLRCPKTHNEILKIMTKKNFEVAFFTQKDACSVLINWTLYDLVLLF